MYIYILTIIYYIYFWDTMENMVSSRFVCLVFLQPLYVIVFTTGFIAEVPGFNVTINIVITVLHCTFLQNPAPTPCQSARNASIVLPIFQYRNCIRIQSPP